MELVASMNRRDMLKSILVAPLARLLSRKAPVPIPESVEIPPVLVSTLEGQDSYVRISTTVSGATSCPTMTVQVSADGRSWTDRGVAD